MHVRLEQVHYKRLRGISKKDLIHAYDLNTEKCRPCMLTKITPAASFDFGQKTKSKGHTQWNTQHTRK